uniref:Serine/threonine-protein kinase D1-3-like ubiquitin-like domain-containing protein n=1 Tax=Pavo cristatus TaxID=9049 RepID=A0A8C9ET64_PAVCR
MSANDSSPPSLQKFSPPTCHAAAPQTPSLSSSPLSGLSSRLSNGSFSTQSLTNSRGSMHGVSFLLQIGLTRETVTIEAQDLSLSAVKDLVCSIVYQKFIPYVDCCILKHQTYSCQGESEEEPKQERMGTEGVFKSREMSVEEAVDGQNVSLHHDQVLQRQVLNLAFKHCSGCEEAEHAAC